ncbi:MAG: hypothetical protein G01um1014106_452 [Parcubacteria group bacterium Gr01-1014_106]|nr:MAG: hypothetical protein G01um1014106_452 [Parcubacteria group bacterium Gr01-1014_106]
MRTFSVVVWVLTFWFVSVSIFVWLNVQRIHREDAMKMAELRRLVYEKDQFWQETDKLLKNAAASSPAVRPTVSAPPRPIVSAHRSTPTAQKTFAPTSTYVPVYAPAPAPMAFPWPGVSGSHVRFSVIVIGPNGSRWREGRKLDLVRLILSTPLQ